MTLWSRRLLLKLICLGSVSFPIFGENWPGWRGPRGDGTSLETNAPLHWNSSSNIAWRTPLAGEGHASPIIWEDSIFLTLANEESQERILASFDRATGQEKWRQTVLRSPLERKHDLNSFASSTPATDGELIYVSFLDRNAMYVAAYTVEGKLKWAVKPGPFQSMHGFCSSPVIYKDLLIVNGDHDGDSYIVALERQMGEIRWKTMRENRTRSYGVPLIREMEGRLQIVLSGDKCVSSYHPATGKRYWVIDGPTDQFVASLVYNDAHKMLFVTGGYPDLHILGIRPTGTGNVTRTHIAWRSTKGVSYVPSPISAGDYFLVVSDAGIGSCYHAGSGKLFWQERMGTGAHASLTSANGYVYFLSDEGITTVVKPGPEYDQIARNELGEKCFASPAISGGQIFIRSDKHLFCIDPTAPPETARGTDAAKN